MCGGALLRRKYKIWPVGGAGVSISVPAKPPWCREDGETTTNQSVRQLVKSIHHNPPLLHPQVIAFALCISVQIISISSGHRACFQIIVFVARKTSLFPSDIDKEESTLERSASP